jgi:hypothetical protein
LRATTVTNIVSSGFGTNESIATTDSYTFSAQGNSQTSAFSLTGTLTYADNGAGEWSDSPENDLSSWHAAGSYSGQFSNSSNLISNSVTGASTQNGSDSETSTSIFPHEDYARGATVVGNLTKVDTSNDEYAYSPTTGQFTQVGSEHDSFVGSGTYSYPSDNGTITGVVGENDSDGAYTQQTTSYDYSGGNWSASGGTGSGSSSTDDGSSYSGDGSYIDSLETTNIQGFSNETGWDATSSNYSWSDELDTWGNWDTVSGTGTFEASSDDESSYIGNGAYNDDISDGSVTGVVSQSGNLTTTSGYSLVIDWNGNQWVNTSGTGSGFSSSTSNGTYSGTGGYSSSVDGGNISGTMQESGLSGASTESSWNYDLDSNGQWEVTAGYGSTNYHTSDQQSYSGSGAYSSSSDGSALSGNMTESGNSGSSQTVVVNSEWLDGSWVDSGSSSQGSSTSDQMSYSATGNYNASVDNGSVNGTINEKGDSGSSYSGSSNSTLGADGNWTITSGSGLGIGSSEDHSSYTGSGDYSTTYNDGSSTSDVEGSINVHGNNDSSASYITNSQWLNDAWVQTGTSQQNNSTEDHSSYAGSGSYSSNTDNATYTSSSEGTITESGDSSSSSNTSIEATLDGNGNWDTDSGNGGGQGSSDDYSSYAGEGSYYQQLPNGWASGPTDQSGDSMSSSSYVTSSEWDAGNWITSGSSSQHSSTSDASSYSGQGNYSDTLSIGITNGVVQQTGDASGNSQSSLSLTLDTSGNWDNVAGNSQSTTDSQAQSSFNGSGTYESTFNGGDVEGTINESGDDQSSSTYSSSGNWDADVSNWVYSGTGEEDASSTDNATYSGDGNYENATTSSSISGDIQQNGDEYSDSGNSVDLVFTSDGQWQTVDGSGSGYGGSDNSTSYLGNGNYVESVANGSVYGTIDESGDDNYSSFYTTNLSLSDGAWVTTGTGSEDDSTDYDSGYTGSGSYSRFSADGSSSSSVNGTVKQVGSHDGTSSSSLDISLDSGGNWITYSGSGTVTDTQSDDSSYTGSGTYSDLYFGSDASDYFNGTINENGDDNTSSSYSVSSGWGNGQLNPNSGNGIESTIEYTHSTYSGSGGYETIYNDGTSNDSTIDGTNSEKGNDDSSFNSTVNSEMTDGVWDDEGTGNGLASGAYSTSYQGSGSGSEAGPMGDIYGTAQESGTTISSYSNKASLSLDDFNGSWDPISGNENSTLNTNDTWSFSGNSSYRWDPINNVSINGTQTDSANHDTSTDSDSTATLDGSGNWIISGSGHDNDQGGSTVSYTGNGPYARAIVGATTVDGSIDESGSRISSWNDPMAISQGTNGSYTYSGTGTSSDSTTDNFKYSGSGSSSVPSQESYDGEVDNSEADSSYTESGNYTSMSNGNSSYTAGTDGNWHMASTTTSDSAENKGNYIFSYHATDNWSDPGDNASGNSTTLDAVNSQFDISDKHNETITSAGTTVGSGSGGGTASASASHFVSYHSDDNGNVDDGTYSEIESYNYTGNWTETMSAAGISGNLLETNIQTGSYSSADSEDPDEDSSSSYSVSLSAGPGFRDYYGGISFSQFAWAYDVDDDWYYSVGGTLSSVNAHMGYDVPPPPVSLANVGGGVGPQQSSNDEPSIVGAWLQGFGEGLVDGVENIGIGIFNTTKEITFQAIDTVNSTADLAGLPHYSGNLSQLGQASSRDDFSIVQNTAETGASLVTFGVYNEVKTGYQLYNGQITVDQASQQFGAAGFFQVGGSLMEMYGPSNEAGETGICGKAGECFVAGTKVLGAHGYRSIERINLGQKVLTAPQGKEFQAPSIEPDNYRAIKLQYVHEGREYELTYLRRADEVEGLGAGDTVRLRIAELEIDGRARVLATGPCPQIESGDGQVVTGVIRSLNLDVRAIKLAGMDEPIEATANHPIYSEDALNFVRTDCLSVGERLRTRSGSAVIESIGRKPGQWEVFNLEVGEVHQYYVSKYDVLVHNAGCGPGTELPSDADYLNENGMYEKSSSEIGLAQEHHIVTTYEGAGIDAEVSRGILLDAAIDLDDEPNLVDVPGHYGPHPAEYHSFVRQTLEEAIEDLPVGSDSYRDAVKSALAELKNMLTDPLNPVTRRISR